MITAPEPEVLTLEASKECASIPFLEEELKIPEPSRDWRRRIEIFEESGLIQQRDAVIFDMRCWQAKEMGFPRIETDQMVKMIMREDFTGIDKEVGKRQNHEWLYQHHTGEIIEGSECNWGSKPTQWYRNECETPWYLPPYSKTEKWRVQLGKLDYLKREIPHGIMLRVMQLRELLLFNCFGVMAPMEAWEKKSDIDPILVGNIWELPQNDKKDAGTTAIFFIAQWD